MPESDYHVNLALGVSSMLKKGDLPPDFREELSPLDQRIVEQRSFDAIISTNSVLRMLGGRSQRGPWGFMFNQGTAEAPSYQIADFQSPVYTQDSKFHEVNVRAFNSLADTVKMGLFHTFQYDLNSEVQDPSTADAAHVYAKMLADNPNHQLLRNVRGMGTAVAATASMLQTIPGVFRNAMGRNPRLFEINRIAHNCEYLMLFFAGGNLDKNLSMLTALRGNNQAGPFLAQYFKYSKRQKTLVLTVNPYDLIGDNNKRIGDMEPFMVTTKCPLNLGAKLINKKAKSKLNGIQQLYRWNVDLVAPANLRWPIGKKAAEYVTKNFGDTLWG